MFFIDFGKNWLYVVIKKRQRRATFFSTIRHIEPHLTTKHVTPSRTTWPGLAPNGVFLTSGVINTVLKYFPAQICTKMVHFC